MITPEMVRASNPKSFPTVTTEDIARATKYESKIIVVNGRLMDGSPQERIIK